jgi:hypothetical protein
MKIEVILDLTEKRYAVYVSVSEINAKLRKKLRIFYPATLKRDVA